jgi:hypothetical protein
LAKGLAWHKTALPGQVVAYHLAAVDRKARKLLRRMEREADEEEREKMELRYDLYLTKVTFLANALTGCQRQRLAEREFDEWMKVLDDAKSKGINPQLLPQPGISK